ncbi:MAG TPA: molybdopterin cofactor-binding domain-containing protein, partial [Bryobacteraceae bacterium]|nr:molybdopterin cofactor-binding domain-containing protein [Bryobacteraceae bacterium]
MPGPVTNSSDSRRDFLRLVAGLVPGLVLGCVADLRIRSLTLEAAESASLSLNAWLRIATDNTVTIVVSQAEMGQGIMSTLPAVLAEELGADWDRVNLETSPVAEAYRNPRLQWQFTGNSESTMSFFELMRQMGASAREMLIAAASKRWKVDAASCSTDAGFVLHAATSRKLSFGSLAEAAAREQPPEKPPLKPREQWKLLGKPLPRVDNPAKVDGSAVFGLDFKIPGMVYAVIKNVPVFGGKLSRIDRSSVEAMPGLIDVCEVPGGVAVIAASYWQGKQAADQLRITWEEGTNGDVSSDSLNDRYREAMSTGPWVLAGAVGNSNAIGRSHTSVPLDATVEAAAKAGDSLPAKFSSVKTAEFSSQFLAHATMEPMNATARVTSDSCEIWAPTQGQELAQLVVAQALKLPKEKVQVHRTFLGGGFGRRLTADYVLQAAVAAKICGKPVKAVWSREEDMQHDLYRPAVLHRITAGVDENGMPVACAHRLVSPSILQYVFPVAVTKTYDPSCLEGLLETNYRIPHARFDFHLLNVAVPTSVLRTTGYGPNIFAVESFIDELAHDAKKDPYLFRRELLGDKARAIAVLDLAAEKARWKTPPPPGVFRGIALCEAFHTHLAQVVEISVEGKSVKVHRVVSAADCGTTLNPNI